MELIEMQRDGHAVRVEPRQVEEFEGAGFTRAGAPAETKRKAKRGKVQTMDDPGDDPIDFPATMDD